MDNYELYNVVWIKSYHRLGTVVEVLPNNAYIVEWEGGWGDIDGTDLEPWDGLPSLDEQNEGILEDHYRSLNMGGWGVE